MMTLLAIIVLIIKSPVIIVGYFFKHKAFLVVVVIIVGAVFLIGYFNKQTSQLNIAVESYQRIAPSIQQAPRVVQTNSRVYYVATMSDDGQVLTLTNYYVYDKNEWQNVSLPLPLDRDIFGEIKIYNRS